MMAVTDTDTRLGADEAVAVLRTLAEAIGWNIAVWQRGGSGKVSGRTQERAFRAVFRAITGSDPTPEQLAALGGGGVFGGI